MAQPDQGCSESPEQDDSFRPQFRRKGRKSSVTRRQSEIYPGNTGNCSTNHPGQQRVLNGSLLVAPRLRLSTSAPGSCHEFPKILLSNAFGPGTSNLSSWGPRAEEGHGVIPPSNCPRVLLIRNMADFTVLFVTIVFCVRLSSRPRTRSEDQSWRGGWLAARTD